jgi:hypothetical protein
MNQYVVLQVTLKEKLIGTASKNLKELEDVINAQAAKGYRLHHTITTASANSTGFGGGTGSRLLWYSRNSDVVAPVQFFKNINFRNNLTRLAHNGIIPLISE